MKAEEKFFIGVGICMILVTGFLVGYVFLNYDTLKKDLAYQTMQYYNTRK